MDEEVSISAVGEALVALEGELERLEFESERLHAKLKLAHTKMEVCRKAIHTLLVKSAGSMYP